MAVYNICEKVLLDNNNIVVVMLLLTSDSDDGSCGWDVVANGGKKCQKKISTENGFACVEKRRQQTGLVKKAITMVMMNVR